VCLAALAVSAKRTALTTSAGASVSVRIASPVVGALAAGPAVGDRGVRHGRGRDRAPAPQSRRGPPFGLQVRLAFLVVPVGVSDGGKAVRCVEGARSGVALKGPEGEAVWAQGLRLGDRGAKSPPGLSRPNPRRGDGHAAEIHRVANRSDVDRRGSGSLAVEKQSLGDNARLAPQYPFTDGGEGPRQVRAPNCPNPHPSVALRRPRSGRRKIVRARARAHLSATVSAGLLAWPNYDPYNATEFFPDSVDRIRN
jgi:hypothetical protein